MQRSQRRQILLGLIVLILVIGGSIGAYQKLGGPAPAGNIVTFMGGNGKQYCGVDRTNTSIQCNFADSTDDTTQFSVEDLGDGTFALKNMYTGQYCSDQGDKIECNKDVVGSWEKFHWIDQSESKFSLTGPKSGKKRHFCADEINRVVCNRDKAGAWETFTIGTSNPLPIVITTSDTVTVADTTELFPTDTATATSTSSTEDSSDDSQSLWQRFLQFLFSFQ